MEKVMNSKAIVHICGIIIVVVASIDTYWLSKNSDFITQVEQNPLGQYLIELDKGDVSLLLDEDEVKLKPFDVVVQRGTNHAWVNLGEEPALLIAVLIDSDLKE